MARVLIVNKFYYPKGGDCIATLSLEQVLKQKGHDVAIFSMQHTKNLQTEWNCYFPSEVKFAIGVDLLQVFLRPFGTKEVKDKFIALLENFKPDIVHLNNIHSQLSPVVAELAKKRGCKVVWTLHDYKLLCPRYDCLRNDKIVCEQCFDNKINVLKYRCMKNSLFASVLAFGEAVFWNRARLEACTDLFICPSKFMADKMSKGGFDSMKIRMLCNFIDVDKCPKDCYPKNPYYCFVGRLSKEKGIKTLIKAAKQLPYKLVIVGEGPLDDELKSMAGPDIEFVGFKQWDEIKQIAGKARFMVTPSEWYENNPISVIEALCLGTPVLGARIGGIPELVEEGFSGMTFESRNVDDLTAKIEMMWNARFDYETLAECSRQKYGSESYYRQLMDIYGQSI